MIKLPVHLTEKWAALRADKLVMHMSAGSATSMSVRVAGLALAFLSHLLLSRFLGAAQYGSYVIALGWAMVLVIPARLGLDNAALRFATIYREQGKASDLHGLIRVSVAVIVMLSAAIAALLLLAKAVGFPALHPIDWLLLAGVAALILPQAILGWLSALIRTANRIFAAQFYEQMLRPALLIAAILLFSAARGLDATNAMLLTAATVAVAAIGLGLQAMRVFRQAQSAPASYGQWRLWLSVSWVLFLMGAVQELLNQIDVILLGVLADATAAAHFAAAWRLASLVPFGLIAIVTVSAPLIASAHGRGDRRELARIARVNARISTAFALGMTVILVLIGRPVLALFGPSFDQAYPVMLILLIGGVVNSSTGSVGNLLALTGHQRSALAIFCLALAVSVGLNLLLIPKLGALGSAIASTAAMTVWNVALAIRVRSVIGVDATLLGLAPR